VVPGRRAARRAPVAAALAALLLAAPAPWTKPARAVGIAPVAAAPVPLLPGAQAPDPGEDRFVAATEGPVTVLHAEGDAGYAREVARIALAAHERIRRDFGLEHEVAVAILLLTPNSPERTRDAWARRLPRWMAGAAIPATQFIVLRVPPGRPARALEPVITHELTHVVLQADFPRSDGWPQWFQEGLAMRQTRSEGLRDYVTLSAATIFDRVIPLERLAVRFPADEAEARLAYAESVSFLGFLETRHGPARFAALMRELRSRPFEEAFRAVYGAGPGALESQWLRWVNRRYAWLPAVTSGTTLWVLATLLFLVAIVVRRRRSRLMREKWEAEDREHGFYD